MLFRIGASLACANQLDLRGEIDSLKTAGVDFLHIDIMDGEYVNNYCFGLQLFDYLKEIELIEIEIHLMVYSPYNKIEYFNGKHFDRISFHIEACKNPIQTLSKIKSLNKKSGIAINAATHENSIYYLYDFADYILIMAVEAGFSGQDFIDSIVEKVRNIRQELKKRKMEKDIYIDGHIDENTIPILCEAGANVFIGGTAGLFKGNSSYAENIRKLRNSCSF